MSKNFFTYDIPLTNLSANTQYQLDRIFRNCKDFNDVLTDRLRQAINVLEDRQSKSKKEYAIVCEKIRAAEGNVSELEEKKQSIINEMNNIRQTWFEENDINYNGKYRLNKLVSKVRKENGFNDKVPSNIARVIGLNLNLSLNNYLFRKAKTINFKEFYDFTYITSMMLKGDIIADFENNTVTLKPGFFRDVSVAKNARKKYERELKQKYEIYLDSLKRNIEPASYEKWKNRTENIYHPGLYNLVIPFRIDENNTYLQDCITNTQVRYCGLKRKLKNNRWTYFVTVTAEGESPKSKEKRLLATMVEELTQKYKVAILIYGPKVKVVARGNKEEKKESFTLGYSTLPERIEALKDIDRYMENSRFATNPDCYKENGQKIKGKKIHTCSKGYNNSRAKRKYQYDCHSETLKNRYNYLAKHIICNYGANISIGIVEKEEMNIRDKKKQKRNVLRYSQMTFVHAIEKTIDDIGVGNVKTIKQMKYKPKTHK